MTVFPFKRGKWMSAGPSNPPSNNPPTPPKKAKIILMIVK
jgi:hypothetical protein